MASVDDRWWRPARDPETGKPMLNPDTGKPVLEKTDRYGVGRRWLLRWRDADGKPHKLSFEKKIHADSRKSTIEADLLRGTYIDPAAGTPTFGTYAGEWLANQTTDPLTRENIEGRLRRYVEGTPLWSAQLRNIRPSTIQAWISKLPANLMESTKGVVFSHVMAILNAAVDDEKIGKNPGKASSVRRPKSEAREIEPWAREWVAGMHEALPERYDIFVTLGAGLGLRQGEMFGLSPDDVDWLRGWVTVERQVKLVGSRLVFALPKGGKVRKVPLPASVRDELAAYLAKFPAKTVELPWREPTGELVAVKLAVTTRNSGACNRNRINHWVWKPALEKVGIESARANGFHALRHYYAGVLLDANENIKAVSRYLGHSSAAITLKYYGHLMPASEERTRSAVDSAVRGWCAPGVPQPTNGAVVTSNDAQLTSN